MTHFFVTKSDLEGDIIYLDGANADHAKVLRIKQGEQIILCDGEGNEAVCSVTGFENDTVVVKVLSREDSSTEPAVKAKIYMALAKSDKLEHVIQKSVELGVHEIIAFPSTRCVSRLDAKSVAKKLERWNKIALSAAEQCGRGYIPKVIYIPDYKQAINQSVESDLSLFFYENESGTMLSDVIENCSFSTISLISGPEGGFEEWEVDYATQQGAKVCSLGKRILRCETAPLCGLSAIMYSTGEF